MNSANQSEATDKLLIIGSGPAGYTAALDTERYLAALPAPVLQETTYA